MRSGKKVGVPNPPIPNSEKKHTKKPESVSKAQKGEGNHTPPMNGLTDGSVRPKSLTPNPVVDVVEEEEAQENLEFVDANEENGNEVGQGDAPKDWNKLIKECVEATVKESLSDVHEGMAGMHELLQETLSQISHPVSPTNPPDGYEANKEEMVEIVDHPSVSSHSRRRNQTMKPPSYDGSTAWSDFLIQYEMACEFNGWSEAEKLLGLGCTLKGTAQEVLGELDTRDRQNYSTLIQALNERFGTDNQEVMFRAMLSSRERRAEESFPAFAHALRRLTKRAYPKIGNEGQDSMALERFLAALSTDTPSVRDWVCMREPTTLNEAVRLAINADCRLSETQPRVQNPKKLSVRAVDIENDQSRHTQKKEDELKEMIKVMKNLCEVVKGQNERRDDKRNKKCYACGKLGHFKRDCYKLKNENSQHRESYPNRNPFINTDSSNFNQGN